MSFHLDDPKLTAYALGELDESERAKVERMLERDSAAQHVVNEVRRVSEQLRNELAHELQPDAAHDAVRLSRRRLPYRVGVVALAACMTIALGVSFLLPSLNRARETASSQQMAPYVENGAELTTPSRPPPEAVAALAAPAPAATAHPRAQSQAQVEMQNRVNRNLPSGGQPEAVHPTKTARDTPNDILRYPSNWPNLSETRTLPPGTVALTASATPQPPAPFDANDSVLGPVEEPAVPEVPAAREARNRTVSTQVQQVKQLVRARRYDEALAVVDQILVLDPGNEYAVGVRPLIEDRIPFNTEAYDRIVDNPFLDATQNPLSTFSIDVDTASYSNIRRFLNQGQLPPKDAVRIEEMLNYFTYDYAAPRQEGEAPPFSSNVEVASCPWNERHRLVRVALKGMEVARDERPDSNLVFLIDVSGSMEPANKLPLLKRAMAMLVKELGERDRVAMVVYAGSSGLVLPSTSCDEKGLILSALGQLHAGGSTNGAQGIELAYQVASQHFIKGGVNRVILCTDGDFNVGVTDQGALTRLIEDKAKTGVFLSVLGFGMGNVKDSTMEKLADKGNGNYAYIDTIQEAKKVLVEQMSGTLVTIAKDVKVQVEFNPARVASYRLIGYENRILAKEDFNDDLKDAGEIGAGHAVTALYEVVPVTTDGKLTLEQRREVAEQKRKQHDEHRRRAAAGGDPATQAVDPLKYQKPAELTEAAQGGEMLTFKLRYKEPNGQTSKLLEFPVTDGGATYARASRDFKFAASVAAFGMILRDSPHKGQATLDAVMELAEEGKGADEHGYRGEFIELVRAAKALAR